MEKINIAELLKDCPKGMELDCTMYENVEFDYIEQNSELVYPIHCLMKINGGYNALVFTHNGCNDRHPNAKCVIFPKGKTTWEGFQRPFKDGDIVTWEDRGSLVAFIYKERKDIALVKHHFALYTGSLGIVTDGEISLVENEIVFATEEEKQKLFDAIKENGYKWNTETKTLEKLIQPKFKVGDRIKYKEETRWVCTIARVKDRYYVDGHPMCFTLPFGKQDDYELVPNKFDITTLKPFDKVLVRDHNAQEWVASLFSNYNEPKKYKYICVNGSGYAQCIPYEGNEHLLGTTDDCDDYHKTW